MLHYEAKKKKCFGILFFLFLYEICECCLEQELHPIYEFRVNEDHCAPVALLKLVRNWEMINCLQLIWKTYQHLCENQFQNQESNLNKTLFLNGFFFNF